MHVRNTIARALPVFLVLLFAGLPCRAQDAAPQFAPLEHGVNDSVNKSNLNVTARIPLAGTNGRGMGLTVALVNNSNMYVPSGSAWTSAPAQYNAGWNLTDNVFAAVADLSVPVLCTYWDPSINGVAYSGTTAHQKFQYVTRTESPAPFSCRSTMTMRRRATMSRWGRSPGRILSRPRACISIPRTTR